MEIERDDRGRMTSFKGAIQDRIVEDTDTSIRVVSLLTRRETVVVKSKAPDVLVEIDN